MRSLIAFSQRLRQLIELAFRHIVQAIILDDKFHVLPACSFSFHSMPNIFAILSASGFSSELSARA
jgi:hypothetical protein